MPFVDGDLFLPPLTVADYLRAQVTVPAKIVTKPAGKVVPKWETETRDRIRGALKKFAKPLADMAERDANEGDTRVLVTDFLCDALGYDKYADCRGRIDKQLVAFIEVKRIATKLSARPRSARS